ncbi:PA2779 family protein [Kaarinaea lacus]
MIGVKRYKKITSLLLLVCFITVSFSHSVFAGIVTTTEIVDSQTVQVEKQRIYDLLARDDVRSQLIAMGVNPEDAVKRVDNMTDQEAQIFAQNMQELPAGGDVLGVLLIVFLVLLFTDIMGWTDIFPFVKKTAN